ncbi:hypothetical protein J437_LFUL016081 [Ladona fulva]|uniref:KN homeodomain domain-containing protein n=1 Tax=Ladona fulva TaxID=123851 RepID=A0A8K0KP48_LADFU|nr:hypothetical protein J437_LFUL016081 [Ladona fulva]
MKNIDGPHEKDHPSSQRKETKRPSKEMQVTIARQLGLEPTTVGNFFMNARRRSMDKWKDEEPASKTSGQSPPGGHGGGPPGGPQGGGQQPLHATDASL